MGDILETVFSLISSLLDFVKVTDGGAEEWEDVESDEDVSARSKSFDAVCNLVLEGEGSGGGARIARFRSAASMSWAGAYLTFRARSRKALRSN